jgi:hypothetical protein
VVELRPEADEGRNGECCDDQAPEWERGDTEQDRSGDLEAAWVAGDERCDCEDSDAEPTGTVRPAPSGKRLPRDQHRLQEPLRRRTGGRDSRGRGQRWPASAVGWKRLWTTWR